MSQHYVMERYELAMEDYYQSLEQYNVNVSAMLWSVADEMK